MVFGKKTQEKLDASFLDAVGDHDFEKARKLLIEGAKIATEDASGNTALHCLAKNAYKASEYGVKDFVCYLLNQGLDINDRNAYGQTCLHLAAANDLTTPSGRKWRNCSPLELMTILLENGANPNLVDAEQKSPMHHAAFKSGYWAQQAFTTLLKAGARPELQDQQGRTVLHIVASRNKIDAINVLLNMQPSLIAIQDNSKHYPHESAVLGDYEYNSLSRQLQDYLTRYRRMEKTLAEAPPKEEMEMKAEASSDDQWVLVEKNQVARITFRPELGYKLTEIFNFNARTYTHITHNVHTEKDETLQKSFNDFANKSIFEEAYRHLKRLGNQLS